MPQKTIKETKKPDRIILLGEDDEDDQEMLKEIFQSIDESLSLHVVNNGNEIVPALDKLNGEKTPCLIVLDYNMPGLNGADILAELNANLNYREIPRIVWSTSGAEKFRQICLQLGAADYVIKPPTYEEFIKVARYMLSLCK